MVTYPGQAMITPAPRWTSLATLSWGIPRAVVLLMILGLALPQALAHRDTSSGGPASDKGKLSVPGVVKAVRPSVVTIMSRGALPSSFRMPSPSGSGSGFVIDEAGYVLTNNHLVERTKSLVVGLADGRLVPGRVVGRDFLLDLAVIKIQAKDLVAAHLGRSASLQIGDTVVAIGNPLALKGGSTVTVGVVSALDRSILAPNGETLYDLIQTDAAINPGNSGGPLVDQAGHVVGVNTAVAPSAQAISYAISIDAAYPSIQSMVVRGEVMRPNLGFIPVTVTPSIVASFNLDVDRGVLAVQVDPAKLVSRLGIQNGDVITAVDNRQVYNMGDFWHEFLHPRDQDPAQLTLFRNNARFSVLLPRVPSSRGSP